MKDTPLTTSELDPLIHVPTRLKITATLADGDTLSFFTRGAVSRCRPRSPKSALPRRHYGSLGTGTTNRMPPIAAARPRPPAFGNTSAFHDPAS